MNYMNDINIQNMEKNETSKSILEEWYSAFIALLKKLSKKSQESEHEMRNEEFASIGTTQESRELIKELCDEIDEEYSYRKELNGVSDKEAWFDGKVKETLDDLAQSGIIDSPNEKDYIKANAEIKEAVAKSIVDEADSVAKELNEETDAMGQNEFENFVGKEEE